MTKPLNFAYFKTLSTLINNISETYIESLINDPALFRVTFNNFSIFKQISDKFPQKRQILENKVFMANDLNYFRAIFKDAIEICLVLQKYPSYSSLIINRLCNYPELIEEIFTDTLEIFLASISIQEKSLKINFLSTTLLYTDKFGNNLPKNLILIRELMKPSNQFEENSTIESPSLDSPINCSIAKPS